MKHHIALIGIRGSGKTTIGTLLASELGVNFVDIDVEIVRTAEMDSMIEVVRGKGMRWFAETEQRLLKKFLSSEEALVLATGGRTFSHDFPELKQRNIDIVLQNATTIFPQASEDELWKRVVKDQHKEHGHLSAEELRQRLSDSLVFLDIYQGAADIIIDTDGRTPDEVVREIISKIDQ